MNDCRFGVSPVNYPDPDPEDFRNIFPSLLILFLFLYAKRTLVFRERTSGSELILIYGDYFIIITSLKKVFRVN